MNARARGHWRHLATAVVAGVLAVALVLGVIMWLGSASSEQAPAARKKPAAAAPATSESIKRTGLARSTTYATISGAPEDPAPQQATEGIVVHPTRTEKVYDKPGGRVIATMPAQQLGDTWLPVIAERAGWVRVLLPSRPNGSTGWLRSPGLQRAYTPYLIKVHLGSMRMELIFQGTQAGAWTVGIGKPDTPTPTGRTFLLGSIVDPNQKYSPVILPLGAHSDTLDSFGGGPGTVAIHTWPTTDVLGTATSHGCIRVPQDALNRLTEVPLGTLVLVDQE